MELESGSKVLVEREHLERLQREAAGEGRVDPIDLAERRLALLKGATKALSSFPSPADPQFLSAAARLVICEGLGVGRELADAANKVDAECAESTQLIAKGEQVRLSMQASQAQPGEVYSFALARRFGWYASSGNPHGRAVLAAARAEGFGPEELRQGLVEVTEGVFKPVNIFTPAGVERFAFLDSHEERQVFEVKTDSQVFTVYRTPGGAPAADAEGGVA